MARPALFLDRDGVINVDHAYVCRPENFEFIDGIFDLVAAAKRANYWVVVVTNQAGIGRGYYSENDFHRLTQWMSAQFLNHGGTIDKVYFCPDHPQHGLGKYKRDSEFRKPGPGMLLQAAKDLDIDLSRSILVGDKLSDIEAGVAAGVQNLFYFSTAGDAGPATRILHLKEVLPYLCEYTS
ncbi:MAG: HAD family hydrolase [Gallionellaceae bacterium]|nr:HAD family hydrolase [Gallionellaceae bacterium]